MRNRNAIVTLLGCGALLCVLPFLAQPGSDLPQQSPEAIEAQAITLRCVNCEQHAQRVRAYVDGLTPERRADWFADLAERRARKRDAKRSGKWCTMWPCYSTCDGSTGHGGLWVAGPHEVKRGP